MLSLRRIVAFSLLLSLLGAGSALARGYRSRSNAQATFTENTFRNNYALRQKLEKMHGRNWRNKLYPKPGYQGSGFRSWKALRRYQRITSTGPYASKSR